MPTALTSPKMSMSQRWKPWHRGRKNAGGIKVDSWPILNRQIVLDGLIEPRKGLQKWKMEKRKQNQRRYDKRSLSDAYKKDSTCSCWLNVESEALGPLEAEKGRGMDSPSVASERRAALRTR